MEVNTAMRIIYKLKFDTHTEEITKVSGLPLIKERAINPFTELFIKKSKRMLISVFPIQFKT